MAEKERVRNSNCVFVGSIPYDATEEQLTDVFSQAGPVVSFRLVFDKENGKSKGYGFCEFRDPETALSAIRNLNGAEFNGRSLRVDYADQDTRSTNRPSSKKESSSNPPENTFSNTPVNTQPSTTSGTMEGVNNMLEGMSNAQIYDMVAKMKTMVQQNQEQSRQILLGNPSLAYALLKAQAMLGMITPQLFQKVLSSQKVATSTQFQPNMAPPVMTPKVTAPVTKSTMVPPMMPPSVALPSPMATPSMIMPPMPPPSGFGFPVMPMGFDINMISQLPEQQRVLLTHVLSMSSQQIEQLPSDQRANVLHLKQLLRIP